MSHYTPQVADSHETFTIRGGEGELICDIETGEVLECTCDAYAHYTRADVAEWRAAYPGESIDAGHDILDFGLWDIAGRYSAAEQDFRDECKLNRE